MNTTLKSEPAADVEIVLSTYNGAPYLDEFLTSLLNQDHDHWSLTVRDDGSSDRTVEILTDWRTRNPNRIKIVDERSPNIGHVQSFSRLLACSTGQYVMFADQDDVWLPTKIRLTLAAMRQREQQNTVDRPVVVSTDAILVDRALRPLGGTSRSAQGFVPTRRFRFQRIMVENIVLGCTAMINRPLADLIGTIPPEAGYHDWWIALVASAFGDIVSLDESLVLWRRHGANETEASDLRRVLWPSLINPFEARRRVARVFEESRPRVSAFLRRYRERLTDDQVSAAEAFLGLAEKGFLARRLDILRHGLFFVVPLRNAGLLALI